MAKHFGCVRFVYNWGLEKKIKAYKTNKKFLSYFDLTHLLVHELKEEHEWLCAVNAQALQMALRNLDNAFTCFFRKQSKFPRFKSKWARQSFQCPQYVTISRDGLSLPKIKNIKIKLHRSFKGKIKTVTVSRISTGKYFASVLVDDGKYSPKKVKAVKSKSVGVDLGLAHFATLSTGEKIDNPRHLKKSLESLRCQSRKLSRKEKGSANRDKQRIKVALLHEKIANQRADFLHKLSKRLIDENKAICLEDLNVNGMLKNRRLARHIQDVGWGTFRSFCAYKADWQGKEVRVIGRFEPSSKICTCGVLNHDLKLSDRVWTCSQCDVTHDRDVLAANNILQFAFIPRGSRKSTPVETGKCTGH
jgi:putative transposase